jgi:hypothetical protein
MIVDQLITLTTVILGHFQQHILQASGDFLITKRMEICICTGVCQAMVSDALHPICIEEDVKEMLVQSREESVS